MFTETNDVISFWQWFESISGALFQNIVEPAILGELDQRVKSLGPFDWEIGPVDDRLLYLAISPCLDDELLKATAEIVSYAPLCEGWWFLYAKPRKEFVPVLNMVNEMGKGISVDISAWSYVLFHFDDDTFDIDVRINAFEGSQETQMLAVDIALTNLLGEETFITLIKGIHIVGGFGENEGKATQLRHLNGHIDRILK